MAIERPTEAHSLFERYFNAADTEGLLSLYEPDARLVLPEGEVVGHDAIRIALSKFIALHGTMHMQNLGIIQTPDLALTTGIWHLEGPDGKTLVQGESIEVFRRHPQGWLASIDCPFGVA
jgi:ketosteroid isomerase-like protein